MIKKILTILLLSIIPYISYSQNFKTNTFGFGYGHFNESHLSNEYTFKNNQINVFGSVYGVYLDVSLGLKEYSKYDGCYMSSFGMDFGYLFPLNKQNQLGKFSIYLAPIVGFQRVGDWEDDPGRDYYDCYGRYHYGERFHGDNTYANYGGLVGFSYGSFIMYAKLSRAICGLGMGIKF